MYRVRISAIAASVALVVATSLVASWSGQPAAAVTPPATVQVSSAAVPSLYAVREVNYYPSGASWTQMWTDWQPAVIQRDFAEIAALGGNTVRVFIFPSVTGFPSVTPGFRAEFQALVLLAKGAGLKLHLSLFDWWGSYGAVGASKTWVTDLLAPYRTGTTISIVELQNELKPQDASAVAWAKAVLPHLHATMPNALTMLSTPANGGAVQLKLLQTLMAPIAPQVWSLHYYGEPGHAYAAFTQARDALAPAPVFVGELGSPTGATNSDPSADLAAQAQFYTVAGTAALAAHLPAVAPWTLNDFRTSGSPRVLTSTEYTMGLRDVSGLRKPAWYAVYDLFHGKPNDGLDASLTNEFGPGPVFGAWRSYAGDLATISLDPDAAGSGRRAFALSSSGGEDTRVPSVYVTPSHAVIPGQRWHVAVNVLGQRTTGEVRLSLTWFDGQGVYMGQAQSATLDPLVTTWTTLQLSTTVPMGAAGAQIHLKSVRNAGTAYFTGVSYSAY